MNEIFSKFFKCDVKISFSKFSLIGEIKEDSKLILL